MNNHLHILEGYTSLLRALSWRGRPGLASRGRPAFVCEDQKQGQDALATGEQGQDALVTEEQGQDALATSLRDLIGIFQRHILNSEQTHLQHFFDDAWTPKSDSYTFGHDIEGSWLLCEAAEVLAGAPTWRGRPGLVSRGRPARGSETKEQGQDALATSLMTDVQDVALRIARTVLTQGLDADGGLFYEGRSGRIINPNREWWPQAEAVVGFYNAWQLTGDKAFREAAGRCWQFIQNHVVDHEHGEWFWCVRPDGTPDLSLPKVSPWKCPYHNGRCCLEIIRRTQMIVS